MASTYSTSLRLELQGQGENQSSWGTKANSVFSRLDDAIAGFETIPIADANLTLTNTDGVDNQPRNMMLNFTGTLTADRTVTLPTVSKVWIAINATSGGKSITLSTGSDTVLIRTGQIKMVFTDGSTLWTNDDLIPQSSIDQRWNIPAYINATGIMEIGQYVDFHNDSADANDYAVRLSTGSDSTVDLYVTPSGGTSRKIWNDGNDGAASGLDADLVDGLHASQLGFATGTLMLFMQAAAPTGWTKQTTYDNRALRIVSGTTGGTGSGTVAFTAVFTAHTVTGTVAGHVLSTTEMPTHAHTQQGSFNTGEVSANHTHTYSGTVSSDGAHDHIAGDAVLGAGGGGSGLRRYTGVGSSGPTTVNGTHTHTFSGTTSGISANHYHGVTISGLTTFNGSNGSHAHGFTGGPVNLSVAYVDAIICRKD